jgi:hypothetical protein
VLEYFIVFYISIKIRKDPKITKKYYQDQTLRNRDLLSCLNINPYLDKKHKY